MAEITEIEQLETDFVSGVPAAANGTPYLLLKSEGDTDSPEADQIEDILTKMEDNAVEALTMLHDYASKGTCGEDELLAVQKLLDSMDPEVVEKAKLKAKERNAIPDSEFAYIDSKGGRHLPIEDAAHVRNALARFNQTHFESSSARSKAKAKIDAKAKSLGIHVSKSPGVPDESVAMPKAAGKIKTAARSKVAGRMTTGLKPPVNPADSLGGESPYVIPVEQSANSALALFANGKKRKVRKGSFEIEVIEKNEDGTNWLSVDNDPKAEKAEGDAKTPGSPAWEKVDAATLDGVARGLATAIRAVNEIKDRETIEAVSGEASDWLDAFQLDCAAEDLANALGLVASLAYHEAAASKVGKSIDSEQIEAIIRAARGHLLSGDERQVTKKKKHPTSSEEENEMTTITKEELERFVAKASKKNAIKAAQKAVKAERKAMQKKAAKNANNGGDITAEDMERTAGAAHNADDLKAVSGATHSMKKESKAFKSIQTQISALDEKLAKIAARPRAGGPVLDGQARGSFPAAEGRLTEGVAKSAEDQEIERLEKAVEVSRDPSVVEQLSRQLTLARLTKAHLDGVI